MERLPIPTAPSERPKWKPSVVPTRRSGWLILTLLLSLAAGFAGALVARAYQFEWLSSTPPDIVIVPNTVTSATAVVVEKLQAQQAEAVVVVKADDQVLGAAVVFSSDGWIVASHAIVPDAVGDERDLALHIETAQHKNYLVDQVVPAANDQLVFLHVPSTGLRVAEFRNSELTLGESLIAYSRTTIGDAVGFTYVSAADTLGQALPQQLGAPLYDFDLALVGFVTADASIIPVQAVTAAAYELFAADSIDQQ